MKQLTSAKRHTKNYWIGGKMSNKKVYCKECKHNDDEYSVYVCRTKPYNTYDWYEKTLRYVECCTRNKHNDCKLFEKKEPEKEEPKLPEKIKENGDVE